jgi:phosphatidate phosphatase APP1
MRYILIIFFFLTTINAAFLFDKEGLLLVPSVAFRDHSSLSSNWILYNQGWYYKENRIQALLMEKSLELIVQKDLDENRIKMFTSEGKKNQDLCINGLNRSMCSKTDDEGRIKNTFTMTNQEIELFRQEGDKVLYQVSVINKNLQTTGEVYLCDDNGITFISDIDDTIKITEVTSSRQTLINTFSGDFKAVSGMADIYRYWKQNYNATFAYLTASPDQLYPFLREFFNREQFPSGSAHMRHYTWFDKNFIEFFMSSNYMQKKLKHYKCFYKIHKIVYLFYLVISFKKILIYMLVFMLNILIVLLKFLFENMLMI